MPEFRFQIGDIVYTKVGVHDSQKWTRFGELRLPNAVMVCERISQECPGGVQLKYAICMNNVQATLLECELVAVSDVDFDALCDAWIESYIKIKNAMGS